MRWDEKKGKEKGVRLRINMSKYKEFYFLIITDEMDGKVSYLRI